MEPSSFESRMRELEYYHGLHLLPGTWTVIRVDGRSFTRFTGDNFTRPFDERFRDHMITTAKTLADELDAVYAYTESDEISMLLPPEWNFFDRELEKVVSVSAGIASAAFTLSCGKFAHFDSRVWVGINKERVIDYFRWRQADAARCSLNGWCYWTLRDKGSSVKEATEMLESKTPDYKQELLFQHGINFNDLPNWQRRGIGFYKELFQKEGFNPLTQKSTIATRQRIKVDMELPMKDDYTVFLYNLIAAL